MDNSTLILGDPHGPRPIGYDNHGNPYVDVERIASINADFIARLIVEFCAAGAGWGGKYPYDGIMGMIWDEVQRITNQEPAEMLADGDGFGRVYRADEYDRIFGKKENKRKPISRNKALAVFDRDGYTCKHCGTQKNLTVDHIHPVSKGGTNDMENLQTLCGSCNSRKGAKTKGEAA